MKIGIIGSGRMGGALGQIWAKAGHDIFFGDIDAAKAQAVASQSGNKARAGTPAEAAAFSKVLLFAPPWPVYAKALEMCGDLSEKVLIDVTNPLLPDFSDLEIGHTTSAAEEIARHAPGAYVVKAFNVLPSPLLEPENRPFGSDTPTVFYCGNDTAAKAPVVQLIKDAGFDPMDCGDLKAARYIESMAMLLMHLVFAVKVPPQIAFKFLRPRAS